MKYDEIRCDDAGSDNGDGDGDSGGDSGGGGDGEIVGTYRTVNQEYTNNRNKSFLKQKQQKRSKK
jgi:hypothetical protein